ncbi:MAG: hypothetical protein IJD88_01985 [Clostridia bacterium]|nr:hypothetical protein [Clostridia bacterium]
MGLFDLFRPKRIKKLFEKALEEEMSKPQNKNEIYSEIKNCYFTIFRLLKISSFKSLNFPDYEDCRRVVVDGNEYDFDNEFQHNDREATEMLCAIDCLIADLEEDNIEVVLREIERTLNSNL